jgi:hypothetical protein
MCRLRSEITLSVAVELLVAFAIGLVGAAAIDWAVALDTRPLSNDPQVTEQNTSEARHSKQIHNDKAPIC